MQESVLEFVGKPLIQNFTDSIVKKLNRSLTKYVPNKDIAYIKIDLDFDSKDQKFIRKIIFKPGNLFTGCLMLYGYVPSLSLDKIKDYFVYNDGTTIYYDSLGQDYQIR